MVTECKDTAFSCGRMVIHFLAMLKLHLHFSKCRLLSCQGRSLFNIFKSAPSFFTSSLLSACSYISWPPTINQWKSQQLRNKLCPAHGIYQKHKASNTSVWCCCNAINKEIWCWTSNIRFRFTRCVKYKTNLNWMLPSIMSLVMPHWFLK